MERGGAGARDTGGDGLSRLVAVRRGSRICARAAADPGAAVSSVLSAAARTGAGDGGIDALGAPGCAGRRAPHVFRYTVAQGWRADDAWHGGRDQVDSTRGDVWRGVRVLLAASRHRGN